MAKTLEYDCDEAIDIKKELDWLLHAPAYPTVCIFISRDVDFQGQI